MIGKCKKLLSVLFGGRAQDVGVELLGLHEIYKRYGFPEGTTSILKHEGFYSRPYEGIDGSKGIIGMEACDDPEGDYLFRVFVFLPSTDGGIKCSMVFRPDSGHHYSFDPAENIVEGHVGKAELSSLVASRQFGWSRLYAPLALEPSVVCAD